MVSILNYSSLTYLRYLGGVVRIGTTNDHADRFLLEILVRFGDSGAVCARLPTGTGRSKLRTSTTLHRWLARERLDLALISPAL